MAFATMPVKNNVLIYQHIYRYSTLIIVYKCNSITKVKNSNEDMILALAGQFKQRSWVRIPLSHLNFSGS